MYYDNVKITNKICLLEVHRDEETNGSDETEIWVLKAALRVQSR